MRRAMRQALRRMTASPRMVLRPDVWDAAQEIGPYPGQMIVLARYPRVQQPQRWMAPSPEKMRIAKLQAWLYTAYRALDFMELHGEGGLYPIGEYQRKQQDVIAWETELAWLARQANVLAWFDSPLLPEWEAAMAPSAMCAEQAA